MKISIFLVFIFVIVLGYIKAETLVWVDQSNTLTFSNQLGWDKQVIPSSNDDTIINNGANVFENGYNINVNSLLLDGASTLLVQNGIDATAQSIALRSTSTLQYYFIYLVKLDLYDNSKLLPLINLDSGLSRVNSTSKLIANFYNDSQLEALFTTLKQVVVRGDFIFNDNSMLNINNINFYAYQESTINFKNKSRMNIDGCKVRVENKIIFNDNSVGVLTNTVNINDVRVERFILNGHSNITFINNQWVAINNIEINDSSTMMVKDSTIALANNITMAGESSLVIEDSMLFTTERMVSYVRNLEIISSGGLNNRADFYSEGDYLKVVQGGQVQTSFGDLHLNATISTFNIGYATSYIGSMHIYKKVEGHVATFNIDGGNLYVHPNSNTSLDNSLIIIRGDGKLYISTDAIFSLEKTEFRNENGTLSTSGIVYVSPDSSILNQDQFFIQASILSSNKSSSIPFTNSGAIDLNGANGSSSNGGSNINKSNLLNDNKQDSDSDQLNEIRLEVDLKNSGSIKVGTHNIVHIDKYTQSNVNSTLVINNSTINSNQTILFNDGKIYGKGTFGNSLNQDAGEFGSRNETSLIDINGDYYLNSNGTILIQINSFDDFSKINILNSANINGNIEIRVSRDLINGTENKQLNIINYSKLISNFNSTSNSNSNSYSSLIFNSITNPMSSSSGFRSIKFKSFDPKTGNEEDQAENQCLKSSTSERSFSVLVGCGSSKSSLSGGAIAGIVVGCAVAVALIGSLIHFRSRITLKIRHSEFATKLKNIDK